MDTYGILQIFSCLVFRFRHLFGFLRGQRGQASVNHSVNQSVKLPMGAFGRLNPTASYASYCGRKETLGTVVASWEKIARKTRNLESGMYLTWVVQHLWNATHRNYQKRFPNRDGENCWSCSRLQFILSWVTISQKNNRRKFRSQTSDNVNRWKAKTGREEKSRRQKIREEKESEERRSRRAKKVGG